ncbi:alpha/beta hydrolase [Gymnodinialimonas sp. 2305UL16-5]|uniref:alpha/beta hydrolase n=1 Tax=Gymnodinialimonas mytili TaxID=3126503 RepID=UPI0030AB4F2D
MLSGPTPTGLTPAPFFAEVADGPDGAEAWWVEADDTTRLRLAVWPRGDKGTVLMFPGRTEYAEKYGRLARDMAEQGYGMVALDWRGQGLADRPQHNPGMGHVIDFDEYQSDVAAFMAAIADLDLPKPYYLIGHSMGGCIGLRALYNGLDVAAAAFTGPMWGIQIPGALRFIAPILFGIAEPLGLSKSYVPTLREWKALPFEGNILTSDPEQYAYMEHQTATHPELTLGGPSYTWLKLALAESAALMRLPALDLPVVAIVGTDERRVSQEAPKRRMADWPRGKLIMLDGARHEILLEAPALRQKALDAIIGLFNAHPRAAHA